MISVAADRIHEQADGSRWLALSPELHICQGCGRVHGEYVNGCIWCWDDDLSVDANRKKYPNRKVVPAVFTTAVLAVVERCDPFAAVGTWYVRHADGTTEDIVLAHGDLVEDAKGSAGQFILDTGWDRVGFVRVERVRPIRGDGRGQPWPGPHVEVIADGRWVWESTDSGDCTQITLPEAAPGGVALRVVECDCPTCGGVESIVTGPYTQHPWTTSSTVTRPCPTCTAPATPPTIGGT